jgi:hypothetical protein
MADPDTTHVGKGLADEAALHPGMTVYEVAAWCAEHRCFVSIDYVRGPNAVTPVIRAFREPSLNVELPAMVRRQAD